MRKWKYLMMSLVLTGSSAMFTGCIDTDEPKGITELRGAKSELIKAQSTLTLAHASVCEADAAYRLAEVEGLKIANQATELLVESKKLELALQSAATDKEIAALQNRLDEIANEREEIAEKHKATMLGLQVATAKAQEQYDNAIKAIEAAKLLLTDDESDIVDKAVQNLSAAETKLHTALDKVYQMQEALNGAIKGALTNDDGAMEAVLKLAVAKAENSLKAAERGVEEIQKLIDKDVVTTDWEKEVGELEDTLLALEVEKSEAEAEKTRIEIANKDKADQIEDLEEAYDDANDKEIELADYELAITNTFIQTELGLTGFAYTGGKFTNQDYLDETGDIQRILDQLENWLELIEENGVVTPEALVIAQNDQRIKQVAYNDANTAHTPNETAWTTALSAYRANPDGIGQPNYEALRAASLAAFGTGANEPGADFRLTAPTDAEVIALVTATGSTLTYADFGSLGVRASATADLNRANAIVAASGDYSDLYDALEAQQTAVLKIANDNKTAVAAAKKAWEDAEKAYDALFDDVNLIIDEHTTMITMYEGLIDTLKGNIAKYLEGEENYADFEIAMEKQLLDAQEAVVAALGDIADAEKDLEMFYAGQYTEQYDIAKAELKLKTAIEAYEVAKAQYDDAYARVQDVIDALLS